MDSSRIPILVCAGIGALCSSSLILFLIFGQAGRFQKSTLGRLVLFLLALLTLFNSLLIPINIYMAYTVTGIFLYSMGVLVTFTYLIIALERYCNIKFYVYIVAGHAVFTLCIMIWSFATHIQELLFTRGTINNALMFFTFGGIAFLYYRLSIHASPLNSNQRHKDETSRNGRDKLLLMIASFLVCYTLFPVCTSPVFYPEWKEPLALDVLSNCLASMDGILTPLITLHLNQDLVKVVVEKSSKLASATATKQSAKISLVENLRCKGNQKFNDYQS
ncbi:hypothetical protein BCR33DRAFT_720901 [Rhizoclosmatium globosum]|uniref:Uncharacterized protein n=1 Tax=Rhizoclosmatium globosum TaxID=329046 RepID=A0A1Y2BTX4_9FUNG|nr:hypothetical protein BCR33DRAFT_720901 [Rhizoclosmatium globosum]|eukprot:ORY38193.1 hypothetical protein BCR33DRAFT_720901 [Rhizoclosmatium globosum]